MTDQESLRSLWNDLDGRTIPVINEDGDQMANAEMRAMANGDYLYVDDVDGFRIITASDAQNLNPSLAFEAAEKQCLIHWHNDDDGGYTGTAGDGSKYEVYWDEQDPNNLGWAYREYNAKGSEIESGGLDATDPANPEEAMLEVELMRGESWR